MTTTLGKPMYFGPDAARWRDLKSETGTGMDPAEEQKLNVLAEKLTILRLPFFPI